MAASDSLADTVGGHRQADIGISYTQPSYSDSCARSATAEMFCPPLTAGGTAAPVVASVTPVSGLGEQPDCSLLYKSGLMLKFAALKPGRDCGVSGAHFSRNIVVT